MIANWWPHGESNSGRKDLESLTLPLSYKAVVP